jgi:hypothetical protein
MALCARGVSADERWWVVKVSHIRVYSTSKLKLTFINRNHLLFKKRSKKRLVLYHFSILFACRTNSWSNWDKSFTSFPPCYSQSPLLTDFNTPPPPPSKSGLKPVCNVIILYGYLKSETFKNMPRNLNKIVRSWILLLIADGSSEKFVTGNLTTSKKKPV